MHNNQELVLVGSNSVHSLRYLNAISQYFAKVIFITNNHVGLHLANNIVAYSINFKLTNFKAPRQIAKIVTQHNATIIHIQQANSYAYHAIKAVKLLDKKYKTILTTWGSDILVLPDTSILFKKMVQFNLNNVDIITSDSLYMSARIKHLAPGVQQLYTINFGMQHFPNILNLSAKEDIILSTRLHKKLYNIDKIIIGFANLLTNPRYSQFKLVIAASGVETQNLVNLVTTLGLNDKIVFTGMLSTEELASWFKRTKIFVSIPESDATSLSVLEAMGYGCYPLLSNLPANLEWVIDEINGTICQNLTTLADDFKLAIDKINNPAEYFKIADFNHVLIKQKAVFNDNINKFMQLYN